MAMNESNNLLFTTSRYHYPPIQYVHSNTNHDNNNEIPYFETHGSSCQSLQSAFTIPQGPSVKFNFATSLNRERTLSSVTIPQSINRSLTTHSSLSHINNFSPILKSFSQGALMKKFSEDQTNSTFLSNATQLIPSSEINRANEENRPIEVRIRCIFLRVGEIDTLNERYTSEIFLEASWFASDQKIGSKYDPQAGHFNPQLVVLNNIGDTLRHEKWYSISKTNENGIIEVTEHHKFRGVFWERMELNHFPYDVQELSVSLTTPLTINDFYFTENKQKPSGVNRTVFSDEQSWDLYEHVEFQFDQQREEYSLNYDQMHPVVACTCHVGRKCGYYIWNAYFLIFLITSAALSTFSIPPSNSHGRLQITCTLLLTSVTFRWVVNKSLPTISYLTALDFYGIASIVALCIINVFHGLISYIYYNQIYVASYEKPRSSSALHLSLYPEFWLCRLDRYGFYVLSILFCVYQVVILSWTFWKPYQRRRSMKQKDERKRAEFITIIESSENSRAKLDQN